MNEAPEKEALEPQTGAFLSKTSHALSVFAQWAPCFNLRLEESLTMRLWRKRGKVNARVASEMKWLLNETDLVQHEIAALYGVNQGRVSEVKNRKCHSDVRPRRPLGW